MDIRMEHTEGLGKAAQVWVNGELLSVCDGISSPRERISPGQLENVDFRCVRDESLDWAEAVRKNPSKRVTLQPEKGWRYIGYGRVEQVMPVIINFGLLRLEDPNWSTDDTLIGRFVAVAIDRLEIVPKTD